MDRDYWINRAKWYDPFVEDIVWQCHFRWWQSQAWEGMFNISAH